MRAESREEGMLGGMESSILGLHWMVILRSCKCQSKLSVNFRCLMKELFALERMTKLAKHLFVSSIYSHHRFSDRKQQKQNTPAS